jgi:hypothetical protein
MNYYLIGLMALSSMKINFHPEARKEVIAVFGRNTVNARLEIIERRPLKVELSTRQRMNRPTIGALQKMKGVKSARVMTSHQYVMQPKAGVTMQELEAQIKAAFRTLGKEVRLSDTPPKPVVRQPVIEIVRKR